MSSGKILDMISAGMKIREVSMKRRVKIIGHNMRYPGMILFIPKRMIEE